MYSKFQYIYFDLLFDTKLPLALIYFHTSRLLLNSSHWFHTSRRRGTLNLIRINPHNVNLGYKCSSVQQHRADKQPTVVPFRPRLGAKRCASAVIRPKGDNEATLNAGLAQIRAHTHTYTARPPPQQRRTRGSHPFSFFFFWG